jgi:MHS family proline/betaine transporter-like MFS transporter
MQYQTWKQRVMIGLGNGFECYEIAIYAAIQSYIAMQLFPVSAFGAWGVILSWLPLVSRYMASPFGGFIVGYYAERYGRKKTVVLSSALTGSATLAMVCVPTYEQIGILAPLIFLALQILQAFSYGAELPTNVVYLVENSKKNQRARALGMMVSCNIFCVILALSLVAVCKFYLSDAEMQSFGWRIAISLGAINILISYVLKRNLSESSCFKSRKNVEIKFLDIVRITLRFAPNTIIFFGSIFANQILIEKMTQDPFLLTVFPILFHGIAIISCLVSGYIIDKHCDYQKLLKQAYFVMIWLSVIIYASFQSNSLELMVIGQLVIYIIFGISMTCAFPDLYDQATGTYKVINIGIGLNLSITCFGAMTPMIFQYLSSFGQAYMGLWLSLGGVLFFVSEWLGQRSKGSEGALKAVS